MALEVRSRTAAQGDSRASTCQRDPAPRPAREPCHAWTHIIAISSTIWRRCALISLTPRGRGCAESPLRRCVLPKWTPLAAAVDKYSQRLPCGHVNHNGAEDTMTRKPILSKASATHREPTIEAPAHFCSARPEYAHTRRGRWKYSLDPRPPIYLGGFPPMVHG